MHLLPVTFNATNQAGRFTAKLRLETDLPNAEPVDVAVDVQVP